VAASAPGAPAAPAGAEAYTLAAVCREAIPGTRVEIRSSDLDRRMVARARARVFGAEDARCAPAAALARFFPGGRATRSCAGCCLADPRGHELASPFHSAPRAGPVVRA